MSTVTSPSKSAQTRTRILDAAASLFRQVGYGAASLRDIAQKADMQAGSLYYHFDSKDELAEAVMLAGVEGSDAAVRGAVAALSPDASVLDRLEAAFEAHLTFLLSRSDYAVAMLRMLHQTPNSIQQRTLERQRDFGRFFGELFEMAKKEGVIKPALDLSALRMLIFGAMNWAPEWYSDSGLTPSDLAAQLRLLIES
ncbi:TetR/AcrR family transcriptional regulator [Parasphingorhabdus sp.]|uniref:TetR/AcrR family transcriptional regulator n=1 Tax=Parasphingorhabdus sp. TaxID=2709688 RepID=UPI003A8FCA61